MGGRVQVLILIEDGSGAEAATIEREDAGGGVADGERQGGHGLVAAADLELRGGPAVESVGGADVYLAGRGVEERARHARQGRGRVDEAGTEQGEDLAGRDGSGREAGGVADAFWQKRRSGSGRLGDGEQAVVAQDQGDRKSTRLNSSHGYISYAVFCL